MAVDVAFDVYSDARGRDPDSHSPTLRRFHRELWSKRLPNSEMFNLSADQPGHYLHHRSDFGEFSLSSDSIAHTYRYVKAMAAVVRDVPREELESFYSLACTVGGYIVFPSKKVDGKATINGARGLNSKIRDRFDLTLECIRRHYSREDSPLSDVLGRYTEFFRLFESFEGYVDFFLLQDMVAESGAVRFFLPFGGFGEKPLPPDLPGYMVYRKAMMDFISARGRRMLEQARNT